MGEWLDARQIKEARQREKLRWELQRVLAPYATRHPKHFERVDLHVNEGVSFRTQQAGRFQIEFMSLVQDVDRRWASEGWSRGPSGYPCAEFSEYPIVGSYIGSAHFWPRDAFPRIRAAVDRAFEDPEIRGLFEKRRIEAAELNMVKAADSVSSSVAGTWFAFPVDGGAFSSASAIAALRDRLAEKLEHYGISLAPPNLIAYYDQAVLYNTPYHDLRFRSFADVAHDAAQMTSELLHHRASPFAEIYLLKALWPDPETFEIWPKFSACE